MRQISERFDPFGSSLALDGPPSLRAFNLAGVLAAADVHVAVLLGRLDPLAREDEAVLLAAALAVRAPRLGHVYADLATVRGTVAVDDERPADPRALPWPDPDDWLGRLASSALVAVGDDAEDGRPLRLVGSRLYLDRYWQEERRVAADLRGRAADAAGGVDVDVLSRGLNRLFGDEAPAGMGPGLSEEAGDGAQAGEVGTAPDYQRLAAGVAVLRRLAVVAGGPGT
ncbi:MAG: exodeoxyribonuclease V subunit alpha, partial [Acidimicrobiales bacterium]